jgi:hypothetical protein
LTKQKIRSCLISNGYRICAKSYIKVNEHGRPGVVESYLFSCIILRDGSEVRSVWFTIDEGGRYKVAVHGRIELGTNGLGARAEVNRFKDEFGRRIYSCLRQ